MRGPSKTISPSPTWSRAATDLAATLSSVAVLRTRPFAARCARGALSPASTVDVFAPSIGTFRAVLGRPRRDDTAASCLKSSALTAVTSFRDTSHGPGSNPVGDASLALRFGREWNVSFVDETWIPFCSPSATAQLPRTPAAPRSATVGAIIFWWTSIPQGMLDLSVTPYGRRSLDTLLRQSV